MDVIGHEHIGLDRELVLDSSFVDGLRERKADFVIGQIRALVVSRER